MCVMAETEVKDGGGDGHEEKGAGREDEAVREEPAFAEAPVEAQFRQPDPPPPGCFGIEKTDPGFAPAENHPGNPAVDERHRQARPEQFTQLMKRMVHVAKTLRGRSIFRKREKFRTVVPAPALS